MVPRNWTIVLAVGLALVLGATALGQGGQLAGLVQPQVVSIEQLVPVDVTLAVPLDDGSVVTATAPITVGISLQVKIDGAGVVIDPIAIFDGRADSPMIEEDPDSGKCVVVLAAAQHWVDFERRPGRHTNHEEQQIWFPGDKGFEFVSGLNREIKWGAA